MLVDWNPKYQEFVTALILTGTSLAFVRDNLVDVETGLPIVPAEEYAKVSKNKVRSIRRSLGGSRPRGCRSRSYKLVRKDYDFSKVVKLKEGSTGELPVFTLEHYQNQFLEPTDWEDHGTSDAAAATNAEGGDDAEGGDVGAAPKKNPAQLKRRVKEKALRASAGPETPTGETRVAAQKRQKMDAAAARGDYVLAGKLQEEVRQFDKLRREMQEAVRQKDFIRAARVQVQVTALVEFTTREAAATRMEALRQMIPEAVGQSDYFRAGRLQEQLKALTEITAH